jgi:hypothetical protein
VSANVTKKLLEAILDTLCRFPDATQTERASALETALEMVKAMEDDPVGPSPDVLH